MLSALENINILRIKGFHTKTILGVHDWEQQNPRPIIINLDLWIDSKKAAISDNINDTIDYAMLIEQLNKRAGSRSYKLIETLAEDLADFILDQFATNHIKLELIKPDVLENVDQISFCIERFR